MSQFITSQFLKKFTQFLVSVSVFTFFCHSFKFHLSTFSLQILSHAMDKNCIFLICNGILMFLAKTSSFSPASDLDTTLLKKIGADGNGFPQEEVSLEITGKLEEFSMEGGIEGGREEEEQSGILNTLGGDEEKGGGIPITDDEEGEKEVETIGFLMNEEGEGEGKEEEGEGEGEGEEEGENGLLSTEELNKKFDEFIRRMKEEMRIGAQQQLLMAY